ncbi:MAG: response regulator [Spirochaetes bacterium]|nr:response regulator [Spirochaetota bacterium]
MEISLLIVDDEVKIADKIAQILKKENYDTEVCSNGKEAIEILKTRKFDIILTDINMPEVDGFQLMNHIKTSKLETVPIVFTGYASIEGAIKALHLGAYDFIQKPVDGETLKHRINKAANHILLQRENEKNLIELKKLNRLKDEFLTLVSHDLRSPLSSIGGYAGYLLKKGNLNDKQERYINVIKDISDHLYSLVNELLDISKIEQGIIDLKKEKFNIGEIISSSVNSFILLSIDKKNDLKFINKLKRTEVCMDKIKIIQVLNNLISNAIKFTEEGEIIITAESLSDNFLKISISDTGIGMSTEEINLLFSNYSINYKTGTRGEKGNGLGIAICRKFIELHNGSLEVASSPAKGSTFNIILPEL